MKKEMKISIVLVLCRLVMLTLLKGPGSVHASSLEAPTIQVLNSASTRSIGTITVSAICPQNYHVQSGSGKVEILHIYAVPVPQLKYAIQFNGPNTQRTAWITTVENKVASDIDIILTATCVAT